MPSLDTTFTTRTRSVRGRPRGEVELLVVFEKLLFAGAVMGGVCLAANRFLLAGLMVPPFEMKAIHLGLPIGVASVVYFVAAELVRVMEAQDALGVITCKLRKLAVHKCRWGAENTRIDALPYPEWE